MKFVEYILERYSKLIYWLNDRCTECGAYNYIHEPFCSKDKTNPLDRFERWDK